MRRLVVLAGLVALVAGVAIPAAADSGTRAGGDRKADGRPGDVHKGKRGRCGRRTAGGYVAIFDGSR